MQRNLRSFPTRRSSDLDIEHENKVGWRCLRDLCNLRVDRRLRRSAAAGGGDDDQRADCKEDRKSTRLNSSHVSISYAVFCFKKKIRCYMHPKQLRVRNQ